MSRVDEALRRAAESSGETTESLDLDLTPPADDIAALAQEPFPLEIAEHRRVREEIRSAPVPIAPPPVAVRTTTPAPAIHAPEGKAPSLFERIDARLAGKTVIDINVSPSSREQYRRLAANLHHAQEASGLKVVMVTSASVGEGKTLTASNLALTFSESYHRNVLLVDADLRRPTMHTIFRVEGGIGLSEGLMDPNRKLPVHQVSARLSVLTAGRPTSNPMAGLTSERMRKLIDEARENFDWMIIDTPPVALLPDANLLATMVDGAVLVVKANVTSYQLVQRAVDAIGKSRILGLVLNHATSEGPGAHQEEYYYYYYQGGTKGQSPNGSS
jgi:protein-tyrosine kinase